MRDVLATIPIVLLVPLIILPLVAVQARSPQLDVVGQAVAGREISVIGAGFRPADQLVLSWDAAPGTRQPITTDSKGRFEIKASVPAIEPGVHVLTAASADEARNPNARGLTTIASVEVTVLGASAPSGSPSASSIAAPTAATAVPTPSAEPSKGVAIGLAPAPTPAPTATPPPPASTPAPTPAPTSTPVALPPGTVGALYVATNGNDGNPGTAIQPFRTIGRAMQALGPGSTLYVRGGTYTENIKNPAIKAGTASARVVVKAQPGERPVLQGLLWLNGASYWTIDGLNVTWGSGNSSGDHMVKMTGGTGWVLQNSELWGARSYAALFVGGEPSNWYVVNNCIHDTAPSNSTNQDHNIYVNSGLGAGPGYIERNLLFNAPNGRNIKLGGSGTSSSEGSANVTIRSNTLYGSSQSISMSGGTRNTLIEWNLIVRASSGALIRAYELSGGNNVARNNLGFDATVLLRTDGSAGLIDGGGNVFPRDPKLNAISCGALVPSDATASAYGRWR